MFKITFLSLQMPAQEIETPCSSAFTVDLGGQSANAALLGSLWHLWVSVPVFDLQEDGTIRCETIKRFLVAPFDAAISSEALSVLLASDPQRAAEHLQVDFIRAHAATPLHLAAGDQATFETALRDTMILNGCYAVTEARHPNHIEERPNMKCLGIADGNEYSEARLLFDLVLDCFRPCGLDVVCTKGILEASPPMIEMPIDQTSMTAPSHHQQIAAAGRLKALFESRLMATGLEPARIDDIITDSIANSAW